MKKTVKTGKTVKKPAKKRVKKGSMEALRVFMLISVIILVAVLISCAVILSHSSGSKENNEFKENNKIDETGAVSIPAVPEITNVPEIVKENNSTNPVVSRTGEKPAPTTTTITTTTKTEDKTLIKPLYQGALVFVIDDAGNNLRELDPFLSIPGPLTIAVLPGLPYSAEAARRIRAAGKEVILHQPMEALGAQNPGPGAIYSGMSKEEIWDILSRNIAEIGPVAGINNHQGSKITMDIQAMETILAFCAANNLYFLDSRTTADTMAPAAAQKLGMKIAERNIFIDNQQDRESMLGYISAGLTRAQNHGSAVMIGHTWSPELAPLLARLFPLYTEQGYIIKTVSDILR